MLNSVINIDLHIHSVASKYKEARGLVDASSVENIDVLLDALEKHAISLFSITDHNRFNFELYKALAQAIADSDYEITLLPGIEFDVSFEEEKSACHIIAIFNEDPAETAHIEKSLEDKGLLKTKGATYTLEQFGDVLGAINLPTILIAHQHAGFNAKPRGRDLLAATDNGIDYCKFGYINALECNNFKIQAILRNDLRDLNLRPNVIMGSDCHNWSIYPRKNAADEMPDAFCASIRALPSFRGLLLALTSPTTRIGIGSLNHNQGYLDDIKLCGKRIKISPGLNAIIGENGVGKSSLLKALVENKELQSWEVATTENLGLEVKNPIPADKLAVVQQGYLQEHFSDEIFGPDLFEGVNNSQFEESVKSFAQKLKQKLKDAIAKNERRSKAEQLSFMTDAQLEGDSFFIDVHVQDDFTRINNPYAEALENLKTTEAKLVTETTREETYSKEDSEKLNEALELVREVKTALDKQNGEIVAERDAKNRMQVQIENYKKEIKARSSDQGQKQQSYREEREQFKQLVSQLAKDSNCVICSQEKITVPPNEGISRNLQKGFCFIQTTAYANRSDLTQQFFESFNKTHNSYERISKIGTREELIAAIPRCNKKDWECSWDELVNKFIQDQERTEKTISGIEGETGIGNTLGERALAYYKYQSNNLDSSSVFLVDQPEDNISNQKIFNDLRQYFNELRDRCQVIMVTHNPLLVVNQDVDNVIILENGLEGSTVHAGCLESEDEEGPILDMVADLMDGGEEAIKRRLNAYEA